jgi:hypothetical protein
VAIVGATPQARRAGCVESGIFTWAILACDVLTNAARNGVITTKGMLLAAGWVAVVFALVATSGLASAAASQILLASGAALALVLTRGSRRD